MEIGHLYRTECDNLRLLASELEQMHDRYIEDNKGCLNSTEGLNVNEYHAPRCIPNLKALLTSSLLIQIQGLLDFLLPKVVNHQAKKEVRPFDKGNVLCWVKDVLKEDINSGFDFSSGPYSRLRDFYKIRNDQTHHGGYLSDEKRLVIVNNLTGIRILQHVNFAGTAVVASVYDIDFSYCRSVINDAETFLIAVEKNLKPA
jgi:hypothetical protein